MRTILAIAGIALLFASVLTDQKRAMCKYLPKQEAAIAAAQIAHDKRAALPRTVKTVCIFDFDDTLVDTSKRLAATYKNTQMYPAIQHMVRLLHALQKHSQIVILTARASGAEALVARNCEAAGIRLKPSDIIATCPAHKKAAWRRDFCTQKGLYLLLVAGDRDTDVEAVDKLSRDAVSLRTIPQNEHQDALCESSAAFSTWAQKPQP